MKNLLKRSLLGLALFAAAGSVAHAGGGLKLPPPTNMTPHKVPEVDPNLAISGLALLAGALTVKRATRSTR